MMSGTWLVLTLSLACASAPAPEASTGQGTAATPEVGLPSVAVEQLQSVLAQGPAVVVDVRTPEEFAGGHVPGALNIPVDELSDRLAELEAQRSAPVYLICASGRRSARASALLSEAGFAQPINVLGGTKAWVGAGYPVD